MTIPAQILLLVFLFSLLINGLLWLILTQRNKRLLLLENQTKTQKKELANVKHRQQMSHDAYRLDADELDKRLQQDYRD